MNERVLTIDGLDISIWEEKKTDQWIVCLHGLQSNKELFRDLLAKPFFASFSLLAIDFVGFGKSAKPTDFSYDIQDQAKVVEKVLAQLEIHQCHIIGHSMGGMVGILLLQQLGTKVVSLINMEGNLVEKDCGASLSIVQQSWQKFSAGGYEIFKQSEAKVGDPAIVQRKQWLFMIPDLAFYKAAKSIVEWAKSEKLLQRFVDAPQKKLYVYGESNAAKAERLPSMLPMVCIPHAGHRMLTDNLDDTSTAIENFYRN